VPTLLLVLAGCGGGTDRTGDGDVGGAAREDATAHAEPNGVLHMEPNRAMDAATRAMGRLKDATYRGSMAFAYPTGEQQVRVDVTTVRGGPCEMRLTSRAFGPTVVRIVDRAVYVRAGHRALTDGFGLPDDVVAKAGGKWIPVPLSAGLTAGCSIEAVSDVESITKNGCVPYAVEEVRGVPTRAFQCWGGWHGPGTGAATVMYVATEGKPVILRRVGRNAVGPCDISMVRWNTRPSIKAPPAARVIGSSEYA
jgi:hypothetical protein